MFKYDTISEQNNGIILAEYKKTYKTEKSYQTEQELEGKLIEDLTLQGYEYIKIKNDEELEKNLKTQIEKLNDVVFSELEWKRFLVEYLNAPNDGLVEKTRKIQEDYIKDFIFDNGEIKNIKIIDKVNLSRNFVQVANQIVQTGTHKNRYDVTILVNGLPLVQIELKKRGVNLEEAFNQIERYKLESYNHENSLFKYVQLFVISNGTYTKYYTNTTRASKDGYKFTCEWADFKNNNIHDLEDFTATFFNKKVLLEVITKYCVFNTKNQLIVLRPYQIAATERILLKIKSSYESKSYGSTNAGGYVWHTTGSGKTLTSFKSARLATDLDFIDKVFFVVDRKDLDYQTMKEYQKFQPDSVNGSSNTKKLQENIEKNDNKIIVTTIQKLNQFISKNAKHEVYDKHCVFIFDECHRSQFGESQKNIKSKFNKYYQFGFTGTPIFEENSLDGNTTSGVFGSELHSYIITDAIKDNKVLKFKVDYHSTLQQFEEVERNSYSYSEKELAKIEKKFLTDPKRIEEVSKHILKVYNKKTHQNENIHSTVWNNTGFNAMFAVQSVEAAKMYYEKLNELQKDNPENKRLKIATIFSFAANEGVSAEGEIAEETFEPTSLNSTAKQFLDKVIDDYNKTFKTSYSTDSKSFQDYYKDLSQKVKDKKVDLLIVVGMFLTGFDAPTLNTLFVDKNLKYHGLIQAYSRTNRILDSSKSFGNIVCFRDLQQATEDAIRLFASRNNESSAKIILERSYDEYMNGFFDDVKDEEVSGYKEVCSSLLSKFSDPTEIQLDSEKYEFVRLFGDLLKLENVLKNFDEFKDEEKPISPRLMQDMKSTYLEISKEINLRPKGSDVDSNIEQLSFDDLVFQIELLKTEEINLDYILLLIADTSMETDSKEDLKSEISRVIRSSVDIRAKENLVMDFINDNEKDTLEDKENLIANFYGYARKRKEVDVDKLIEDEKLELEESRFFINKSIENGYVSAVGVNFNEIIKNVSRRNGAREAKKRKVLEGVEKLVDIYEGI